jgi:hypothetical protein
MTGLSLGARYWNQISTRCESTSAVPSAADHMQAYHICFPVNVNEIMTNMDKFMQRVYLNLTVVMSEKGGK